MLKEKILNFEREHRIVPKVIAATSALSVASIGAFADGEIETVTEAMTSSLTDLVGKAAVACAGVVGVALTIFGIKWVVKTVRSFFATVGK